MVEMALFMPASRYFSEDRLDAVLEIDDGVRAAVERYISGDKQGQPFVVLLPHMTMSEAASLLPRYFPGLPTISVVFRPLNQPLINAWVEETRSRFGNRQLSRRSGYNDAMAALRRGEGVALLFDQDAMRRGATSLFMGRVASLTDLPGLMALRFHADVQLLLLERTEFWQAKLSLQQLPKSETATEVVIRAHNLLEAYLRRDTHTAPDWLWLHGRWGHQCWLLGSALFCQRSGWSWSRRIVSMVILRRRVRHVCGCGCRTGWAMLSWLCRFCVRFARRVRILKLL